MSNTIYNFEELVILKLSRQFVREIYLLFKDTKDYGFRDQIQRAAVSIMNNIAEGFQRNKFSKDNKQFVYFLNIAYGSCAEVRNMLYIAEDVNYISPNISTELRDNITRIEFKIENLIKKLQQPTD
jgi:four helix bundle protein